LVRKKPEESLSKALASYQIVQDKAKAQGKEEQEEELSQKR
jgi:hypothetical protein